MPCTVEAVPKFTPPANVTLLNPIVPVTVPVPANATVPLPPVKKEVPLAKVPPDTIVKVPPEVITMEPLLVTVVAVNAPLAPKVSDFVLFTVIEDGAFVTEAFTVTAWSIVTVALAGGNAPPNQVEVEFQSPACVEMYPLNVKDDDEVAVPPGVVTEIVPVAPPDATVAEILVALFTLKLAAATPPIETAVAPVKLVPVILMEVPTNPEVGVKEVMVGAVDDKPASFPIAKYEPVGIVTGNWFVPDEVAVIEPPKVVATCDHDVPLYKPI